MLTGEVDLSLLNCRAAADHGTLNGLSAAATRQYQAQHRQCDGNGHGLGLFQGSVEMKLRDMRDFVRQYAGNLAFVLGGEDHAGEQRDYPTRGGKRVDGVLVEYDEGKSLVRAVAVSHQPVSHVGKEGRDLGVFHQHLVGPHLHQQGAGIVFLLLA